MSIQDHVPAIDNRRYDDIMAELRTRVARYTPEWTPLWTDVNDSDPGITLTQLFAWLADMLLYRLGQVPELNYLKFLQLLGIELNPAAPARTEITFPVVDKYPERTVIVPLHTQVAAESKESPAPIIFETERGLMALQAKLSAVQVFDGYTYLDYSSANEAAAPGFAPFGPLARAGSALMLGFKSSQSFPDKTEVNLAVTVVQGAAGAASYECGLPATPIYPSAEIVWEYWNGRDWTPLNFLKDETSALTRNGHIYLKSPGANEMRTAALGKVLEPLYWLRARLARSQYERPPKVFAIRTNTVAAIQAQTVRDERLGGSTGRPNQVFTLANHPVLHESLRLEVDEGDGFLPWQGVEDFFASTPLDHHYVLNRTTGDILFGDGSHGAIPVANVENPGNIVAREYRYGGGKQGNAAAGKLTTLLTSLQGIDENGIKNLWPAVGGREEEQLVEAKRRAPRALKSQCRAVTAEDFEHLAMEATAIKRAKALPLFHPSFPGVKVPGVMTVVVVPDSDEANPVPSEGTIRTVCDYLNQRRLLTTELYVIPPTYRRVAVAVEVIANGYADLVEVKEGIEKSLLDYFHPLRGGEDGLGWPFGGDIHFSLAFRRVLMVGGVQRVERLAIWVDGSEIPECQDVTIAEGVLVYSTEHDVRVRYAFDE